MASSYFELSQFIEGNKIKVSNQILFWLVFDIYRVTGYMDEKMGGGC